MNIRSQSEESGGAVADSVDASVDAAHEAIANVLAAHDLHLNADDIVKLALAWPHLRRLASRLHRVGEARYEQPATRLDPHIGSVRVSAIPEAAAP